MEESRKNLERLDKGSKKKMCLLSHLKVEVVSTKKVKPFSSEWTKFTNKGRIMKIEDFKTITLCLEKYAGVGFSG